MSSPDEPRLPSSHPDYARQRRLAQLFNLSLADYDAILAYQGGVCAICKNRPTSKRHAVDHDHASGLIRGLLCYRCNKLLGYVEALAKAIGGIGTALRMAQALCDYIAYPPAVSALGAARYGRVGPTEKRRRRKKTTARPKRRSR